VVIRKVLADGHLHEGLWQGEREAMMMEKLRFHRNGREDHLQLADLRETE
jgi:hypothetical protein